MAYGKAYYVDPTAAGSTQGSTGWADAWTNVQSAFDAATAGQVVYCRGTQSTSITIDIDTNSGDLTGNGYITFIGCANAGTSTTVTVDGTRFCIDGKNACIPILATTPTLVRIENFEIRNSDQAGYDATGAADNWLWVNCISHDNATEGWDMTGVDFNTMIKCQAYNNTNSGFNGLAVQNMLQFCVSYNNGVHGFNGVGGRNFFYGCIAHDNGGDAGECGFYYMKYGSIILNCVADKEIAGMDSNEDLILFIGNRITSCSVAIDCHTDMQLYGWNYLHDNNSDLVNPTTWSENGAYSGFIRDESENNTNLSGLDADDGYNDKANHDFNIKASRTYNGETDDAIDTNFGT